MKRSKDPDRSSAAPSGFLELYTHWQDLELAILGAGTLVLLIVWEQSPPFLFPLRLILGFLYALFVPGYCLQAALFPHVDALDTVERIGLSLGLSVAWLSVLVLLLDRLPWGLHRWPIVLGQVGSILLFAAIAEWRRSRLRAGMAAVPALALSPRVWWRSQTPPEQRVYKLLLSALLLASLPTAWIFLVPSPDEFMTEFYMLGREGQGEAFPRAANVGEDLQVRLGIANRERQEQIYRVEVWAVDPWQGDRRQLVAEAGPIELATGETHEWSLHWEMAWTGKDQVVEFLLFRHPQPPSSSARLPLLVDSLLALSKREDGMDDQAYRRLRLWLDVLAASPHPPSFAIFGPSGVE